MFSVSGSYNGLGVPIGVNSSEVDRWPRNICGRGAQLCTIILSSGFCDGAKVKTEQVFVQRANSRRQNESGWMSHNHLRLVTICFAMIPFRYADCTVYNIVRSDDSVVVQRFELRQSIVEFKECRNEAESVLERKDCLACSWIRTVPNLVWQRSN